MMMLLFLACTPTSVTLSDRAIDDTDTAIEDPWGDTVYEPFRLLEVSIELEPDEWDELRHQKTNILELLAGDDCLAEPFEKPYTWFDGTVTIDGEAYDRVGVRKKGLLGSVEPGRPSLKLRLDRNIEDQAFEEVTRFTLNNGRQDQSRFKTCMGYEILARAGVAAPRCSLAHVVVNGEDLGLYSNVEPIKPPLLARSFGDEGDGDVFEGTLSDFREDWVGSFENKTNGDTAPLDQLTEAFETLDDEDFVVRVEELVDLDQFLEVWAMEVILGHWDGYNGNTNNFWLYVGEDGRLRFIPWGIDAILVGDQPFGPGQPTSVVAASALSSRLYAIPETRERYLQTLDRLLDEVWKEARLREHLDELVQVGAPYAWPAGKPAEYFQVLDAMDSFLATRQDTIQSELANGQPVVSTDLRANPCLVEHGTVTLAFDTTWGSYGTLPTFSTGDGSLSLTLDDVDYPTTFMTAIIGEYEPDQSVLFIVGTLEDGNNAAFYGLGPTSSFESPGTTLVDWNDWTAYLLRDNQGDLTNWQTMAWISGELQLEESSLTQGDQVLGTGELTIWGGRR